MNHLTIVTLRVLLACALVGSVTVQVVMVPLLAADLGSDAGADLASVRAPVIGLVVAGILAVQVVLVCIWRLLSMVRRGTVFSPGAFRYVDVIVAAVSVVAGLIVALGVVLAPGDAAAPGVVLLIGGAAGLAAVVALVIRVQRVLLAQAVDRDIEAEHLRSELDEVI